MKINDERAWARGFLSLLIVAGGLTGCATGIQYSQLPKDSDPSKEISLLSQQLGQAKLNQVDAYAPKSFADAAKAYQEAVKARDANKDGESILDRVAKSRAYLAQSEDRAGRTQAALGEVVTARTRAVEVGAPNYPESSDIFTETDGKLRDFSKSADRSEGPPRISDSERTQLLAKFKEAELHAIEDGSLGHAQELIGQARKEGAEKLAPRSLATAHEAMARAKGVVRMNPADSQAIEAATLAADKAAQQLLDVTRMTKANQGKHPEAIASAALSEQAALAELKKQSGQYQSAGRLTETVKQIQAQLDPDDAQVFEDGSQVHIRLKGLKFDTGSATINPDEYSLMGRVGKILKDAQPEEIRIDGRTDSIGSKKTNQKLSEKRAESVKRFLVASNAVEESKVSTEGYGSSKPIASEKTPQGRALNRSIDIVLVPGAVVQSAGEAGQLGETVEEQPAEGSAL